jgi:class 3 adenylate cyclase
MTAGISLNCRQCNFTNPPGMRFCGNCGVRLLESEDTSISGGETITAPDDRLKTQGDLTSEAILQTTGQRRNVTILFADLADYTSLSEKIDNEVLFDLVQKIIHTMVDVVYRYEGMVDKILETV